MKMHGYLVRNLCGVSAALLFVAGVFVVLQHAGSSMHTGPSRVMMEIMGMSAALESYNADHGHYPSDPNTTERLRPNAVFDPAAYVPSSEFLYRALSGQLEPNVENPGTIDGKRYYDFKPGMLRTTAAGQTYVVDPDGNSYGYSNLKAVHPDSPDGVNPTFDLWSTCGHKRSEDQPYWCKNW